MINLLSLASVEVGFFGSWEERYIGGMGMFVNWYKVANIEDLELPSSDEVGEYALSVMESIREEEKKELEASLSGYREENWGYFKLVDISIPVLDEGRKVPVEMRGEWGVGSGGVGTCAFDAVVNYIPKLGIRDNRLPDPDIIRVSGYLKVVVRSVSSFGDVGYQIREDREVREEDLKLSVERSVNILASRVQDLRYPLIWFLEKELVESDVFSDMSLRVRDVVSKRLGWVL